MAFRNHLQAAALFTLLLITEAVHTPPIKAAKFEMKPMVREVLRSLRNEATCKHEDHAVGCLAELKSDFSDCQLVSVFGTYLTQASGLNIQMLVTEQLQEISQYLQSIQNELCMTKPGAKGCHAALFTESDGDYEKVCKVMSLLELLKQWLHR